ncbi:Probable RNA polymerase sigma factor fecI [Providencia rustigianii]|uniref:RNA polymerase sigma factor n=1 Tax=Providencia rustigianii TaxID=158850 RepID=UPI000D8580AE|nr:sigma-70 family RNA polymerase sigma factor [Providencia rustigianii]SPY76935.1 Probable RNA polymerase sigma factor fecI [Providencia rustigianii]VEB67309.1 Probable RNA polymerase sigma factor fecI [Providencia rustigianii]
MSDSELQCLFARHSSSLCRYLNGYLKDYNLSMDIMQESFVRMAELMKHSPIQDVDAYLYRTAKNLMIDYFRQQKRHSATAISEVQWESVPSKTKSLEAQTIREQQIQQIQNIIGTLPQRTQEIFRLHREDGMTQNEVAETLNISLSTVEKHLANALAMLIHKWRD